MLDGNFLFFNCSEFDTLPIYITVNISTTCNILILIGTVSVVQLQNKLLSTTPELMYGFFLTRKDTKF
jgi:hypothetical protein